MHYLKELVQMQKQGMKKGIYSACTANNLVIEAVLEQAKSDNTYALIEATANQVNQYGGYTGMLPKDFMSFVKEIAKKVDFPIDKLILGGDHLGPLTFKHLEENQAMAEAETLIKMFVEAGYTKIHIDTSMKLKGDVVLTDEVIAKRGAMLCKAAESVRQGDMVYIVGSEVPIPGGAMGHEEGIKVTSPSDFENTYHAFELVFKENGLEKAWDDVIGFVVQPGVEFDNDSFVPYDREKAKELTDILKKYPNIIFEGHSTDYQPKYLLTQMIQDGIAILKVGPALTFALREGLMALSEIEDQLVTDKSNFMDVLKAVMIENPGNWEKHYHGNLKDINLALTYSFSDRCRYYLTDEKVVKAQQKLIDNLRGISIPLTMISEYLPMQYKKIINGKLKLDPEEILKDKVKDLIDDYKGDE